MNGPAPYPTVLRPRRDSAAIVCLAIGLLSFVAALTVAAGASDKANSAAGPRDAASRSAAAASSSASVARSLPSPQDVRARFPLPAGAFTKPGEAPNSEFTLHYVRGMTFEQVKAFYVSAIPRAFPALTCRFDSRVPPSGTQIGDECQLRTDVAFGQADVWFAAQSLRPGELLIRLALN